MMTVKSTRFARPICPRWITLVFFPVLTRPGTFVHVARTAVRGRGVLIFRECDRLSGATTAVERHSLPPGGYGPRDNAILLDYLRRVCVIMPAEFSNESRAAHAVSVLVNLFRS